MYKFYKIELQYIKYKFSILNTMSGETKDPSQIIFDNDIIYPDNDISSTSSSGIYSIQDINAGDYCMFIKICDKFDENYTENERMKLVEFYKEKISLHEKSKYITDSSGQKVRNTFKDSGFDLVVPWVQNIATEMDGIYFYKSGEKKLCNLRVQIGIYKAVDDWVKGRIYIPSPYYLYARSSIYKTDFSLANNVGIIDSGYRGNICAALHNTNHNSQSLVKMGTRMTQICMPGLCPNFHVRLVSKLTTTDRGEGGFGSTGQ